VTGVAGRDRDGVRLDPRPLLAVAALVVLLAAVGALPRWPGLLHTVALPPLDVVNDLGALLTLAGSWPAFLLGLAASLLGRSVLLALLLGGLSRSRFLWALRFYLLVTPPAFVAATLLYGAGAVMLYALFWAGVLVTLLLVAATAAAAWLAPGRLRSGFGTSARAWFRLGTVGAYTSLLLLLGAVADLVGPAGQVLLVPVSAALTYGTALVLVRDPAPRWPRRALAALPAAGAVALVVLVAQGPTAPPPADALAEPRPGSVLLMSGVDSRSGSGAILEIDPRSLGWTCEGARYFSYAGPGQGQPQGDAACPVDHGAPYRAQDSLRSRDDVTRFLEQQSAAAPPPVVLVTHSQGVWLAWEAAATGRLPGVHALVLVGAFADSGVAYRTGDGGPGRVGRLLLDALTELPRPGGSTAFHPDSPLGRQWLSAPDEVREVLSRPLPEQMRAVSIPSAFDLPLVRGTHRLPHAADACPVPVIHPDLPYAPELHDVVGRFLDGEPLPPCGWWRSAAGPLLRHFAVPPTW
jgi:hypothetical protein